MHVSYIDVTLLKIKHIGTEKKKKKLATPWAVHFNNPTNRSLHQGTASPWKTWSAVTVPGDGGRGKGPFVVGYGGFG